ncbi:MAG: rod shape-determining protein MreD [Spirochaetales bacterium]|nr:rod shape-determining protein MreD [Spirochaetales bacterium]
MLKSLCFSTLVFLCASLFDAAILSNITILPALPDLSLLCLLYIAINNGKLAGETCGFISGLFIDFLSAAPFGLNCIIRTLIGYLCGIFAKTLNLNGIFIPAALGFIVTIFKALVVWVLSLLFPGSVISYNPISWLFLTEVVLNTVLTPLIFKILSIFKKRLLLNPEKVS